MWTVVTVLAALGGLLALPSTAEAQRPRLNLRAGPHSQHASTEHGSPTFRFQVAASGNRQELRLFCGDGSTAIAGRPCAGSQNSHNTVKLEFDVKWQSFDEYGRQRYGGYPVHTKTGLVSQGAVNNSNMTVGESPWVWDRTVNGIPRDDQRPLRATVTMTVVDTTKARTGSTTTHQLNLNPQITVVPQSTTVTEGSDSHAIFGVFLDPPALETTTVQYATSDGTATAGSDYTATSGTLTFAVSVTVLDAAAATLPGGTVAVAGTTIWTADMTVTDYGRSRDRARVATVSDDADEDDSALTVTLTSGETYRLDTNDQMASSVTVLDAPPPRFPAARWPLRERPSGRPT